MANRKTETNACRKNQWKCNDGDCILIHEVCDGIYNCKDKSDETVMTCSNDRCPSYTFRCNYGACVNCNSECNGRQDCVDNSDELSVNCPGVKTSFSFIEGNCSNYQFQCDNGECIQENSLCDGAIDCKDASDETIKSCSNIFCPLFGFRCGYGGCVIGTAKCDGNQDCADGSDEENLLCNYTKKNPIFTATITEGSCRIMELPLNGKASYEAQFNTLQIGDTIEALSIIEYRCDRRYILVGDNNNFCIGGMWRNKAPSCKKYCSNIRLFGVTIKAACELNGMPISCEQKLLPKTIARLTCNNGYRKPNTKINDLLRCGADGRWDHSPFRCEQICGIEGSKSGVQYIIGGAITNNTKVPWHVGIYSSIGKNNQFTQICGGTIINAKVIITAAHCFWDQSTEGFYDKKYFKVVAGKYYRDYYAVEPLKTQTFAIDQFFNIQGYNDGIDRFNNDIALLLLDKYIEFRSHILPICVDWNLTFNDIFVPAGWLGLVAGWGLEKSSGDPSPKLKVVELPTIDYNTCKNHSTPEFRKYITSDKFCAGFTDTGVSVCQGDSGGGLVFPKKFEDGETQYFLRGLVSTGANKAGSCDNNKYTTFTNIQHYIRFIIEHSQFDENYLKPTSTVTTLSNGSCIINELPFDGIASYDVQFNTKLKIGDTIGDSISIVYRCNRTYILVGHNENFCMSGMWSNNVPSCKKYCSNTPLLGVTIKANCELNGIPISCDKKLLPMTIARLRCKNGYRKPNTKINDLLRCDSDGQWNYSPFRCEQICGIDGSESGVQYIVGGEKTNNTKVPWHVGIYSSIGKNNQFTQICGGTIINAKVIITAALCFWDQSNERFHDKKYFQVVAGKYYRNYYANEPLKTQMFAIDKFHSIQGYNDFIDKFHNNIALLVLDKYIEFRSHITPICIDWNLSYKERYVRSFWWGRVAGWGLGESGGEPSPELKVIELPTVDNIKCKHDSTPEFRKYITSDTFCAGYNDVGLSVCQGDSGGGLVFPKNFEGEEKQYFLRGLVSTGANRPGSCDNNKYSTFTNIQYHIAFIGNIESEFRAK